MATNQDIHENADLKNIGLILKKKREELSYTLEHVSEITRITLTCLRNIEEGNMNALPGLVFVRGFVRNYAKLLGLESDWMIEALNQTYTGGHETPPPAKPATVQQEEVAAVSKNTVLYYSLGIAIVCAVLIVVYVLYNKPSDQLSLKSDNVETVQAVAPQEELNMTGQSESKIAVNNVNNEPVVKKPSPPVISPLTLTLVAQESEWIRLAIDGQEPFELRLKKGEKYEWPAEEEYALVMTTGKTATVHLNGEEIVERESYQDQLYEVKLNKFTLKQINNRQ